MGSPLNPNARKVGKRSSGSGDNKGGKGGSGDRYELDPTAPKSYQAHCGDCGSLGLYLNPGDAQRAEQTHQQNKHANSPGKPTASVAEQNKRNKGQGRKE